MRLPIPIRRTVEFTSSGTYNPSPGTRFVIVEIQAAGGGGRNYSVYAGGGGGGGEYACVLAPVTGSVSVTVGASSRGSAGGNSSFGSVSAVGGGTPSLYRYGAKGGGTYAYYDPGTTTWPVGVDSTYSNYILNTVFEWRCAGASSGDGNSGGDTPMYPGGAKGSGATYNAGGGGASMMGAGGKGADYGGGSAATAGGVGAGGGGGSSTHPTAATGGNGKVIVHEL